jgi:hypothetical protein
MQRTTASQSCYYSSLMTWIHIWTKRNISLYMHRTLLRSSHNWSPSTLFLVYGTTSRVVAPSNNSQWPGWATGSRQPHVRLSVRQPDGWRGGGSTSALLVEKAHLPNQGAFPMDKNMTILCLSSHFNSTRFLHLKLYPHLLF